MNTTHTPPTQLTSAADRLAAAGIATIPVESCADDGCPWCEPRLIPFAA